MHLPILTNKLNVRPGVFLSFLFHVVILCVFSFTYPVQPSEKTPRLKFLGSILKNQELLPATLKKEERHIPLDLYAPERNGASPRRSPYEIIQTHKPSPHPAHPGPEQKKTLKSIFMPTVPAQRPVNKEDIGIDVELPPYEPLRTGGGP